MTERPPGVTVRLADFVAGCDTERLPAEVLHHAKRCLLDHLGVALAGSGDDAARIARDAGDALGSGGTAAVLGSATPASAPFAALANGVAAHVLDYDDTYNPGATTVHTSAAVWPAILAAASLRPTTGATALAAFVAGFETATRVGLAAGPSHYDAGWHVTGTVGHIGAAAAAARVLGCDAAQTAAAIGTGATQAAGMKTVYGSMGKALHAGKAASDGVVSGWLAHQGFTSSPVAIEGNRGFLQLHSDDPVPERAVENIGVEWTLPDNGFKAYACGSLIHPSIDAVLSLRSEHALDADAVTGIDLDVHDYALTTTGNPNPQDGLQAKFSIYHCVAIALTDGAARLSQFTDAKVSDPAVIELRGRIAARIDDQQTKDSATARLTLADGRTLTQHIAHNKGTPANPMSDDDLTDKFTDLAGAVLGEDTAHRIANLCWTYEEQADATALLGLATAGGRA